MPYFLNRCCLEIFHTLENFQHFFIKITHIVIGQIFVVHQIPLAAGIFARPSVTFTWEVNPFGMPEFISHKVQITSVDSRRGQQADHFMQSNTTVDNIIFVSLLHVPVHIGINQAEDNRLVSYQCLVMTFCIRNGLFILATVGYFPEHTGRFPVFIDLFFDCLDPVVRNIHGHTIIEAVTAIFYFGSQSRHTGNFFGNGYRLRIYLMNHFISQCQVTNCIIILMTVEIISVVTESFTQSMAVI